MRRYIRRLFCLTVIDKVVRVKQVRQLYAGPSDARIHRLSLHSERV